MVDFLNTVTKCAVSPQLCPKFLKLLDFFLSHHVLFLSSARKLGFFCLQLEIFCQVVIMVDFLKEDSEALKHVSDPHFE